jgi:hypothetical protein
MDNVDSNQNQEPVEKPESATEKMLRQSEVNDIVGRAKREAVESYRRQNEQKPIENFQPHSQMGEHDYRRVAAEEAQRLRDEWISEARNKSEAEHAQRVVNNFWDKIAPGKDKYEDFDKITGDIEYSRFPNVVQLLADHIDNSHDVLYELGKDRLKMAQLEQLSQMSPRDAITHAKRLSQSIKDNESASTMKHAREPLSQSRPSNIGSDSGAMSVSDYRRKYKV